MGKVIGFNKKLTGLVLLAVMAMPIVATGAGSDVVSNTTLPSGWDSVFNNHSFDTSKANTLDITQNGTNGIIKWNDFSIGANAVVNFNGDNGFNTLNYVTGGNASQIYGKLNAAGGNIYLVNPSGVQIGNSAEINVGTLHVANKTLDFNGWNQNDSIAEKLAQVTTYGNAELMSLGYINANKVTFEGNRVVIDADRLNLDKDFPELRINTSVDTTSDEGFNIVLGTDTLNAATGQKPAGNVYINGTQQTEASLANIVYSWIKSADDLDKINANLNGNYALRNAIDMSQKEGFSIGSYDTSSKSGDAFSGKFDGLGNNIFGYKINNGTTENANKATGLFAYTDNAHIGNFNMIEGATYSDGVADTAKGASVIGGKEYTGALIGYAKNTAVNNVTNTNRVTGNIYVGGLVGYAEGSTFTDVGNTGNISGIGSIGGLVGALNGGSLGAKDVSGSYNFGKVMGLNNITTSADYYSKVEYADDDKNKRDVDSSKFSHGIGGLVGSASGAAIGGGATLINGAYVEGGFDVGGIVGFAKDSKIANVQNEGYITGTGYYLGDYTFHTDYTKNNYSTNGARTMIVRVGNVGGIAGSIAGSEGSENASYIQNATNKGDVVTDMEEYSKYSTWYAKIDPGYKRYIAGNVGGIVGSAQNSNLTDVTNLQAKVYGAHNVGGIVGSFGRTDETAANGIYYSITKAVNDGGDIMGTGAVVGKEMLDIDGRSYTQPGYFSFEVTRSDYSGDDNSNQEAYITGNIGGVVGYISGVKTTISGAGNRGNVHSYTDGLGLNTSAREGSHVPLTAQTANVGGIAGKVDRSNLVDGATTLADRLAKIKSGESAAGISDSYNVGNVSGYTNVGGIGGFVYNASIAGSYNLGNVYTTRVGDSGTTPVNVGGIVGDSTEASTASVILYDVYNKGLIGSSDYSYYGRHVGGIIGRLSGIVEKAYNMGEIYNGSAVTGGIAGYWYNGYIKNVFNTGNITVYNIANNLTSDVGGIVGGVDASQKDKTGATEQNMSLSYAYNLGTLRSFRISDSARYNYVAGMIGEANNQGTISIHDVYTTGNIASYKYSNGAFVADSTNYIGAKPIVGNWRDGANSDNQNYYNVYYIKPAADSGFYDASQYNSNAGVFIDFDKRFNAASYQGQGSGFNYTDDQKQQGLVFADPTASSTDMQNTWRIDEGSGLPILNSFYSDVSRYNVNDSGKNLIDYANDSSNNITITHGTAYDPYLTIINNAAGSDLTITTNATVGARDSFAVYGSGININFTQAIDNILGVYSGTVYADGKVTINAGDAAAINFGKGANIYGAAVDINAANAQVNVYGNITATGNTKKDTSNDALTEQNDIDGNGSININAKGLDVYWKLTTAENGKTVTVDGVGKVSNDNRAYSAGISDLNDPTKAANSIGSYFANTTGAAAANGNLTISAQGDVNILYGSTKTGKTTVYGDMTVTSAAGNITIDSDLTVGGKVSLVGDGDLILDVSHIGAYDNGRSEYGTGEGVQGFFKTHSSADKAISFAKNDGSKNNKAKIAFDMWDSVNNTFDFSKYDIKDGDGNITSKHQDVYKDNAYITNGGARADAMETAYVWVSDEDQLAGIQKYAQQQVTNDDGSESYKTNILGYNFALKNNIEASSLADYDAIGGSGTDGTGFSAIFDGMGKRIVGLTTDDGGIFGKIAANGQVKNIAVYSGSFSGANAGAIAATTESGSTVDNITGMGNTVTGWQNVGGIVGLAQGTVQNAADQSTVIADLSKVNGYVANIGGIVGNFNAGESCDNKLSDLRINSAVIVSGSYGGEQKLELHMGGIVGANIAGAVSDVTAKGIVGAEGLDAAKVAVTVGGIVSLNNSTVQNAYNESIVHGNDSVGGIAGDNIGRIENVANALRIEASSASDVGGLVGKQVGGSSVLEFGRNTAAVTGASNVGGLVGFNENGSILQNLDNGFMSVITGVKNVGGLVGYNEGTIEQTAQGLSNAGKIYGKENVGGVVGYNTSTGLIENIKTDVTLYVKDNAEGASYFGGVVGKNEGRVINATNNGTVDAQGAYYVGGLIGYNTNQNAFVKADGTTTENRYVNKGSVTGKNFVGGIIGLNAPNELNGLDATNEGSVKATDGGAGGIFGKYVGSIANSTLTNKGNINSTLTTSQHTGQNGTGGITGVINGNITGSTLINEGTVICESTGINTGGLFGVSTGQITESTLQNNGIVMGINNIGGLIGVNSGNITSSSLINGENAWVTGETNVGGLIGSNSAIIEGGRDADNTYYKYKVYNNGQVTGTNQNVGGLIGYNNGSLTAAYNTGSVTGRFNSGSAINVGGVVGYNKGTVDQVFNSMITKLGDMYINAGSVTGFNAVGGIVGYNDGGTVQNAYSTTYVDGIGGNIVGTSVGGTISNVYGYASQSLSKQNVGSIDGTSINNSYLIGEGTSNDATDQRLTDDDAKKQASYTGFATDKWKFYEGNTNPLLKVFLTKVTLADDIVKDLVYNGADQLTIAQWIANGKLSTNAVPGFDAYNNNSVLISGNELKNAGNYSNWLWSGQIAAGGSAGHNNLGYDFDVNSFSIAKAALSITLNDVTRTYGSKDFTNNTSYGIKEISGWQGSDSGTISYSVVTDGAVDGTTGDKKTNNAGNYTWNAGSFTTGDTTLDSNYSFNVTGGKSIVNRANLTINLNDITRTYGDTTAKNYSDKYTFADGTKLVNGDSGLVINANSDSAIAEGTLDKVTKTSNAGGNYTWSGTAGGVANLDTNYNVTINKGKSEVTKADLTINLNDITRTYGDTTAKNYSDKYTFADGTKLVNGDSGLVINANSDSAIAEGTLDKVTKTSNAGGNYTWSGTAGGVANLDTNYNVTINKGKSEVTKAQLNIVVDNKNIISGEKAQYTGMVNGLVNGDSEAVINIGGYDLDSSVNPSVPGTYTDKIGVLIGGRLVFVGTDISLTNYDVNIAPGTLTVSDDSSEQDDYWFSTAPWDKVFSERERRAEFSYIDGGMKL